MLCDREADLSPSDLHQISMASIARVENRHREQGAHPHGTDLPRDPCSSQPRAGRPVGGAGQDTDGAWLVGSIASQVIRYHDTDHRTVLEKSDLTDSVIDNETLKGAQVRGAQPQRSTSRCTLRPFRTIADPSHSLRHSITASTFASTDSQPSTVIQPATSVGRPSLALGRACLRP